MNWLNEHRYLAILAAAAMLILTGGIVVMNRSAAVPAGIDHTWGSGIVAATVPSPDLPHQSPPAQPTLSGNDYQYVSPFASSSANQSPLVSSPNDAFDWSAFQAALTSQNEVSKTPHTDSNGPEAYSFIPSGLITTSAPSKTRSPADQALYVYGNDVGDAIQSYEQNHPNQTAILTDFDQDRNNAVKIAAMKRLGADLSAVGDDIDNVSHVPPEIGTTGSRLANAYREIGAKLATIPDATGNPALLQAILTYDAAAERFAHTYVDLALIFQANGITFTQDEPGSVFMFPNTTPGI